MIEQAWELCADNVVLHKVTLMLTPLFAPAFGPYVSDQQCDGLHKT